MASLTTSNVNGILAIQQDLFRTGKFSDLTIKAGEQSFKVHKAIEATSGVISLDDDPDSVRRMISFIYTCDYDDEVPLQPTLANNSMLVEKPALFSSIRVYAVAEKYDIKDLKELARSRFSTWASENWNHSEFSMMIQEVYDSTPDSDRGLRDIVEAIVKKNVNCALHSDEFMKLLMSQMRELGVAVLTAAVEEVHNLTEQKQRMEKKLKITEEVLKSTKSKLDKYKIRTSTRCYNCNESLGGAQVFAVSLCQSCWEPSSY
ncbi:MAG: hypothetical protein M1813_004802 [Trichoglossum hirsutum]|nr:MAG: hypothetical protein M1813_004802 [Trichoglossum hirsutum]